METLTLSLVQITGALLAGLAIGYVFGLLQDVASKHNARLQREGRLRSAWSVMPGSAGRVAVLLVILALIQVVCPMFFQGGVEWFVSGGVAAGYGFHLYRTLRQRLREVRG